VRHWVDQASFSTRVGGPQLRPKQAGSPYFGKDQTEWKGTTRKLLRHHPLSGPELTDAVLRSWNDIFDSNLGPAKIGRDIFPAPQIMGFLLHELIPLRLSSGSAHWRRDATSSEKDLVYVPDARYSIEIKTSSHRDQVFGNRSFGQENPGKGKKAKSGYYCLVNFENWNVATGTRPRVRLIRFGWLDSTDWVAQAAPTGQNSSLPAVVYNRQLLVLHEE
jgi:ScaI restriction endonuclease